MYYDLDKAKELVIKAGLDLLEKGLVARTWGNISARISEDEFVITPSGREYDDIGPDDLVLIKVADASYEGNIKPSSEKILHAACYRQRPECSFIIHTHQLYATAIGSCGRDFEFAPCAAYGLPGTQKLADAVEASVKNNVLSKAFLMERHGAVVLGESFEEAFDLISALEKESMELFFKTVPGLKTDGEAFFKAASSVSKRIPAYIDDFAQILGSSVPSDKTVKEICTGEDAWAEEQILLKNCAAMIYAKAQGVKPMNWFDTKLQRYVYLSKYSKLKQKNR